MTSLLPNRALLLFISSSVWQDSKLRCRPPHRLSSRSLSTGVHRPLPSTRSPTIPLVLILKTFREIEKMGLDSLGGLAIHIILPKLGPKETAMIACVSQRFRVWAFDDSLWSKFCAEELNLSSPEDPLGNPTPSFQAFVVERYKRPMPKLRNTTPDTSRYEETSHCLFLHEGKANDHDGPMDIHQIAEKFRIDVVQVKRILQFVSLPPENSSKQNKNQ